MTKGPKPGSANRLDLCLCLPAVERRRGCTPRRAPPPAPSSTARPASRCAERESSSRAPTPPSTPTSTASSGPSSRPAPTRSKSRRTGFQAQRVTDVVVTGGDDHQLLARPAADRGHRVRALRRRRADRGGDGHRRGRERHRGGSPRRAQAGDRDRRLDRRGGDLEEHRNRRRRRAAPGDRDLAPGLEVRLRPRPRRPLLEHHARRRPAALDRVREEDGAARPLPRRPDREDQRVEVVHRRQAGRLRRRLRRAGHAPVSAQADRVDRGFDRLQRPHHRRALPALRQRALDLGRRRPAHPRLDPESGPDPQELLQRRVHARGARVLRRGPDRVVDAQAARQRPLRQHLQGQLGHLGGAAGHRPRRQLRERLLHPHRRGGQHLRAVVDQPRRGRAAQRVPVRHHRRDHAARAHRQPRLPLRQQPSPAGALALHHALLGRVAIPGRLLLRRQQLHRRLPPELPRSGDREPAALGRSLLPRSGRRRPPGVAGRAHRRGHRGEPPTDALRRDHARPLRADAERAERLHVLERPRRPARRRQDRLGEPPRRRQRARQHQGGSRAHRLRARLPRPPPPLPASQHPAASTSRSRRRSSSPSRTSVPTASRSKRSRAPPTPTTATTRSTPASPRPTSAGGSGA